MASSRTPALLLAAALAWGGCAARGCGHPHARDAARPSARTPPDRDDARCRREIAHAAVATPPGLGAIDVLVPTCGPDDALTVWALRGHTLSRLTRPRRSGGVWVPPEVVATGADRLGPLGPDDALGPAAWRSPTVALEGLEGDEWWAGFIDPGAPTGARVRRGSVALPAGAAGLGIIAPVARTAAGIEVLTTVARAGDNPRIVRHTVAAPRDEVEALGALPAALAEGELKAWEGANRVALAYAVAPGGASEIRVLRLAAGSAEGLEPRGALPVGRQHVLVVPRGVARGEVSVFVLSEFDVVPRDGGACIALDETLCVAPGAVTLVRVAPAGTTTVTVAPRGLADTVALDEADRAVVLYVNAASAERAQAAARVDLATGTVERLSLAPAGDLPPLDRPALVRCGREPWLAAEVLISDGAADAGRAARESAVIALPMSCLVRPTGP